MDFAEIWKQDNIKSWLMQKERNPDVALLKRDIVRLHNWKRKPGVFEEQFDRILKAFKKPLITPTP